MTNKQIKKFMCRFFKCFEIFPFHCPTLYIEGNSKLQIHLLIKKTVFSFCQLFPCLNQDLNYETPGETDKTSPPVLLWLVIRCLLCFQLCFVSLLALWQPYFTASSFKCIIQHTSTVTS